MQVVIKHIHKTHKFLKNEIEQPEKERVFSQLLGSFFVFQLDILRRILGNGLQKLPTGYGRAIAQTLEALPRLLVALFPNNRTRQECDCKSAKADTGVACELNANEEPQKIAKSNPQNTPGACRQTSKHGNRNMASNRMLLCILGKWLKHSQPQL